jgi:hypothetical protein
MMQALILILHNKKLLMIAVALEENTQDLSKDLEKS